jgi:phage shock protein PspC (stress-responsive transcriptional regulator)
MMRQTKNQQTKRLYRSRTDKILGGVCGGIAEYFHVDPVLIRVLWVILIFIMGTGILAYLVAWLIMPLEPRK